MNRVLDNSEHTITNSLDNVAYSSYDNFLEKGLPFSGELLKVLAKTCADKLGVLNFKASNGWLDRFKKRHNLSFKTTSVESKSTDTQAT